LNPVSAAAANFHDRAGRGRGLKLAVLADCLPAAMLHSRCLLALLSIERVEGAPFPDHRPRQVQ